MNSRAVAIEYRLSQWAQTMQERVANGESIDEFCLRRGISRNKYFYWQKKLRETACQQLETLRQESGQAGFSVPSFAEVKLEQSPTRLCLPEPDGKKQDQICIETGGVRITAASEYPADKLAALVRELMRPC